MEFLAPSLKNSSFFFRRTHRVFHHRFFGCFNFTTDFHYCWLHLFISRNFYSQVVFTLHSIPTFATVLRVLQIWESLFYSQAFFTLHSFPTFGTTCFYQGFPWSRQFFLERCRASTKLRNIDPTHLFESHSVRQKLLVIRFYLCVRGCYAVLTTLDWFWTHYISNNSILRKTQFVTARPLNLIIFCVL